MLLGLANGKSKPIADAHVHIYQPSRPGGVAWPDPSNMLLFKDFLPGTYHDATAGLGILLTNVVEASPRNEDTAWVLDQIKGDSSFFNYAAELDLTANDFIKNLDAYAVNGPSCPMCGDMVAGVRAYLWNGTVAADDPVQSANLAELQRRGMTLDIVSLGQPPNEANPKANVAALAAKFPNLRIIIDHMGGAKLLSASPDPRWESDMSLLAFHNNVYMKFSAFFDMANAGGDVSGPWTAPKDAASYAPVFDVVFDKFGEDRLIWGSNYPVCLPAGTVAEEVKIAEDYLATKGPSARDKVMFKNAVLFYRRIVAP
jgi:predicted TIM-barrel fold metal-dependent hydrolase